MAKALDRDAALAAAEDLIARGVAVHWLRPRDKMPIEPLWSDLPVHTAETLRAQHRSGANLGVRLGEPSETPAGYLHLIDLDIRKPEHAKAAWAALDALWPEARTFPIVASGSGGNSRHIYFVSPEPFRSRKLAVSDDHDMVPDPRTKKPVKKRHWEIELFGSGKQAVLPPSIHPDTGLPYRWLRPLPLDTMDLGIGPEIPVSLVASWGVMLDEVEDDTDPEVQKRKRPLGMTLDRIDAVLWALPEDDVEDHDAWLQAGMAIHHETKGSAEGFALWCEWSKQSAKFKARDTRARWKSFDAKEHRPVRMATLVQRAGQHRNDLALEEMPDLDGEDEGADDTPSSTPAIESDLNDLLGESPSQGAEEPFWSPTIVSNAPGAVPVNKWRHDLAMDKDGEAYKSNLPNVRLIIENDIRTRGVIAYNEFRQQKVIVRAPGAMRLKNPKGRVWQLDSEIWRVTDAVRGTHWTDTHGNNVRNMIEAQMGSGGYGLKVNQRDLDAAVDQVADANRYHPVREVLLRAEKAWDGTSRMDYLFVDYLGAEDCDYAREAARLIMVAAVTRIFEPGHKFDFVPILEGEQGVRKSTFVEVLGMGFKGNLAGDFHDEKKMVEKMLGYWIMEMPELAGFSRAEVTTLKNFVTQSEDKVRLSYERNAREFPRQCVFIGTTNDDEYLRDTKNRRYWPIKVTVSQIDTDRLKDNVVQLWGEAVAAYREMRRIKPKGLLPLYLRDAALATAVALQDDRRMISEEEGMAGEIANWLDQKVDPAPGFDDLEPAEDRTWRTMTCVAEVRHEFYGHDRSSRDQRFSTLIGKALNMLPGWQKGGYVRTEKWGQQRVYVRIETVSE